jgi:hypothetical protein
MQTLQAKQSLSLKQLYEIDDNLWLEKTIELLKENRLDELDLENLIEELESLGRRDKSKVASLLEQIIRHLLLLEYWEKERERNANHWRGEIYTFRTQLERELTTNLRNYLDSELDSIYHKALGYVRIKTNYSVDFPDICPYSLTELLNL